MTQIFSRWKQFTAFFLITVLSVGVLHFIGSEKVSANTTPQTLPFTQDWTNVGLITANDDWAGVPGIVGFLGDYTAASPTGIDPRTLLFDMATVDVIANQANPDSLASGGVAEFEITNPTVALNGSGTADAPSLIIYLNTTGQNNIRFSCNLRDVDNSADNSVQPVAVQYRVGSMGDFSNVPGGFVADASFGPSMTGTTPLAVTLPPQANNKPEVQIRILTTNAPGNDEWIGIDDISVTPNGAANTARSNVDFNGDGRSDFVVTRNTNTPFEELGGATQKYWYVSASGTGTTNITPWGLSTDINTPADFDGDGRTDLAVWRSAALANFYILQSSNNTFRIEQFGQTGDDPRVVGDYDGDGSADLSVYRCPGAGQCTWFYRTTPGGAVTYQPWGNPGSVAVPGDYDGDGKWDFNIRRDSGGSAEFVLLKSGGGVEWNNWGLSSDTFVPGDYDGDGKFDYCAVRNDAGNLRWYILERDGGGTGAFPFTFGLPTDVPAAGDYDGDGRQDIAVWRSNADPTLNFFFVRNAVGALQVFEWGQQGDTPTASWYNH